MTAGYLKRTALLQLLVAKQTLTSIDIQYETNQCRKTEKNCHCFTDMLDVVKKQSFTWMEPLMTAKSMTKSTPHINPDTNLWNKKGIMLSKEFPLTYCIWDLMWECSWLLRLFESYCAHKGIVLILFLKWKRCSFNKTVFKCFPFTDSFSDSLSDFVWDTLEAVLHETFVVSFPFLWLWFFELCVCFFCGK